VPPVDGSKKACIKCVRPNKKGDKKTNDQTNDYEENNICQNLINRVTETHGGIRGNGAQREVRAKLKKGKPAWIHSGLNCLEPSERYFDSEKSLSRTDPFSRQIGRGLVRASDGRGGGYRHP